MPIKPKRLCNANGCTELVTTSYCSKHEHIPIEKLKQSHKKRPYYHAWYSSQRWKELRIYYLKLNPLCVYCLKDKLYTPSTVVDHIVSHRGNKTMFWDINNLQALCKPCHDIKTATIDRLKQT
jgi:5-methylcytosine-specific restriction protein A